MNALETRKRLLVAESDLHRTRLVEDLVAIKIGARSVAGRARSIGAFVSSAAVLVAGLVAVRRRKAEKPAAAAPSWLRTIIEGAGLVSTLWLALRAPPSNSKSS